MPEPVPASRSLPERLVRVSPVDGGWHREPAFPAAQGRHSATCGQEGFQFPGKRLQFLPAEVDRNHLPAAGMDKVGVDTLNRKPFTPLPEDRQGVKGHLVPVFAGEFRRGARIRLPVHDIPILQQPVEPARDSPYSHPDLERHLDHGRSGHNSRQTFPAVTGHTLHYPDGSAGGSTSQGLQTALAVQGSLSIQEDRPCLGVKCRPMILTAWIKGNSQLQAPVDQGAHHGPEIRPIPFIPAGSHLRKMFAEAAPE